MIPRPQDNQIIVVVWTVEELYMRMAKTFGQGLIGHVRGAAVLKGKRYAQ
jgi:hypothetical protein